MPVAKLAPDRPPPEDYYQNNCQRLFAFVLQHYEHLVEKRVALSLTQFLDSSNDAQRLFARLLTRKRLVRLDTLTYTEVNDLPGALAELSTTGLVEICSPVPGDELLNLLKKNELCSIYQGASTKLRKDELIAMWLSEHSDPQIVRKITPVYPWVCVATPDTWQLAKLLYFGDRQQDWSAFVIQDLGMIDYEEVTMQPRFAQRRMLEQELASRKLSDYVYLLDDHPNLAAELHQPLAEPQQDRFMEARRQRTLLRLGQWYERQQQTQQALWAYGMASVHPARERMVRILSKQGNTAECDRLLNTIAQTPYSEEEAQFAQRFGKRQAGYQPPTTTLTIDSPRVDIEEQGLELLLDHNTNSQAWGAHVENLLIPSLTWLIYWQAIFTNEPGAFTNPFQAGPNDLYHEDFTNVRQEQISTIERATETDQALYTHLCANATIKYGIANSLVSWPLFESIPLEDFLTAMPMSDIRNLCAFLIRNLATRRAGMPDLFLSYGPGEYELVEVKGPNDQLQPGQRIWFKHFERLNIPARILKLKVAPEQVAR